MNTYIVETIDGNETIVQAYNKRHVIDIFKSRDMSYSVDEIAHIKRVDITELLTAYDEYKQRHPRYKKA